MKCTWLWAALGAAFWTGCGDPNLTGVTQLNLDRPVDISFACYGAMRQTNGRMTADPSDPILQTAQPVEACAALSPPTGMGTPVAGQEPLNGVSPVPDWYAFILQSASGTVALAKWPSKPADAMTTGVSDSGGDFEVLDGDPLTPGKNAIAIGEDPIAIATDKAGCFEVTANAGSCDLSELEINSVFDHISPAAGKPAKPVRVDRVPVINKMDGMILAKPAAMVAEPGSTVVGTACSSKPTGRVFIAYPSCHLVAGVDTATGKIVAGIRYDATGVPTILSGPDLDGVNCPAECTDGAGTVPTGSITPGPRPVALDLRLDKRMDATKPAVTSRLAIGASNSASLTIVELDPETSEPKSLSQVALEDTTGKLGITAVALSPQIGMGGTASAATGAPAKDDDAQVVQGQYVYAVATDRTVRVADVLSVPRECDTQIDGRFLRGATVAELQCLNPRDPARPRRSGARGPGIELPGDAVPTSVAISKPRSGAVPIRDDKGKVTGFEPVGPSTLIGSFAVITASSGAAYVVNIDDDGAPDVVDPNNPLETAPVLVMAHQLRDSFSKRGQGPETTDKMHLCEATDPLPSSGGGLSGGPRLKASPAAAAPAGTITLTNVLPLPTIQQVACTLDQGPQGTGGGLVPVSELDFGAPATPGASGVPEQPSRDDVYPDLRTVNNETWTLTWEGTLSLDNGAIAVDGPVVRSGQITVDGQGMTLVDPAQPFCEMGVEPFDVVDLRGCSPANGDGDCPAGYTCYVHPKSVGIGVGACMLKSEAPRLADACFQFLTTLRRYTVHHADAGQLTLLERKHELAMTPLEGCVDDTQCNQLAQDAVKIDPTADPFTPQTHWACEIDPLRAPINSTNPAMNKRCIQTCSTDTANPMNCATGTICRLRNPSDPNDHRGICLEGVEPPQECVRGPQRYDVRASEAFTVIGTSTVNGSSTGYVHTITKDPKGPACTRPIPNPTAQTVKVGRIPINPTKVPACAPLGTTNPFTGELTAQPGVFEPNPCSLTVKQFDTIQPIDMPACSAAQQLRPPAMAGGQPEPGMRDAQAIRFRNQAMKLTLVDPYQSCLPNGQGSLAKTPLANRGYQIEFAQKAGFSPLTVPLITPTYPVKVVRGPSESFWVIDDGDFLSANITEPSTRGRVFRVEGVNLNVANILQ